MAQVLSAFITPICMDIHGALSLTRFSAFYFFLFLLSVPVFLFHLELFLELDNLITMQNLRPSANKGSNDAYDVHTSLSEAMQWINEVEMVDSVDDFKNLHHQYEVFQMPNFEVLDAKIA